MKLATKITIFISILAGLTAAVLGYNIYSSTYSALQEAIDQNQLQVAQETMSTIDRTLYERYLDVQTISKLPRMLDMLNGTFSIDEAKKLLMSLNDTTGPWDIIFVVDKDGVMRLSTNEEEIGENISSEKNSVIAFKTALNGEIYYSDLLISDDTGKPTIIFAAPVRDSSLDSNPIIGAVLGNYSWSVIQEILAENENLTHLYNNQGTIIGVNKKEHQNDILTENQKDYPAVKSALAGQTSSEISLSTHGGFNSLTSFVPEQGYLGYKGNGWALLLETPTSIAFASAKANAIRSVYFFVVFLIAAVILLLFILYRLFLRPITKLQSITREIAAGRLDQRAEIKSKDEIGQLADSFNQMVEKLLGAEKYTQSIVQSMPTSLIVVEPDAKIKSVNSTTCELLGYTEKQLVGQPIEKIFGAAAAAAAAENIFRGDGLEKLIEKGTIKDEQVIYLTKKGEEIPVSVSGSVMRDEKGKLQHIVVVAKDLREIKKYAEERLAKITPILQKMSMGDFSENIEIPEKEDEFTEHLVALNLMIDDLRETVGENVELVKALKKEKSTLEQKVKERTVNLDAANQQLRAANQQMNAANQQLVAAQKNLQDKLLELERFNKVAVGRELKMVELKEEIKRLQVLKSQEQ